MLYHTRDRGELAHGLFASVMQVVRHFRVLSQKSHFDMILAFSDLSDSLFNHDIKSVPLQRQ